MAPQTRMVFASAQAAEHARYRPAYKRLIIVRDEYEPDTFVMRM